MTPKKPMATLFSAISIFIIATLFLTACAGAQKLNDGTLTVCHATGNTTTPYEKLSLNFNDMPSHSDHLDDVLPYRGEDCPKALQPGTNLGKITICHATGKTTDAYNTITIYYNGLRGHSDHANDIIPAPAEGCPTQ